MLAAIGRMEHSGKSRRSFTEVGDNPALSSVEKIEQGDLARLRREAHPLPARATVGRPEEGDPSSADNQALLSVGAETHLLVSRPVPGVPALPAVPAVPSPI